MADKELVEKCSLTTPEWEKLHKEWKGGKWFGYCWEDVLLEAQLTKAIPIIRRDWCSTCDKPLEVDRQKQQVEDAKRTTGKEIKRRLESHNHFHKIGQDSPSGVTVVINMKELEWQAFWEGVDRWIKKVLNTIQEADDAISKNNN